MGGAATLGSWKGREEEIKGNMKMKVLLESMLEQQFTIVIAKQLPSSPAKTAHWTLTVRQLNLSSSSF